MKSNKLTYFITFGVVLGIGMLMVIQYFNTKNVRELIKGNESLLSEYKQTKDLTRLQKDLLVLDNNIQNAAVNPSAKNFTSVDSNITKLAEESEKLKEFNDSNLLEQSTEIHALIEEKLTLSRQLADSLQSLGHPVSGMALVKTDALKISDKIIDLTHKMDTSGKKILARKIELVDVSGQKVLDWNLYIIVLVVILLTGAFLIIMNRMKKQGQLIDQLNISEHKLKEAVLVKENFLANMSHEIRTPLNAILGYTDILKKSDLSSDDQMHVATVHKSGETLLAIVNDILDLSKIESGMMRIEEVPFHIEEVVHSVVVMFQQNIEEKGLSFELLYSPMLPQIVAGDSTRLTQILVNLLSNAIKFTPAGKITLKVEGLSEQKGEVVFQFTIVDTGIGIDQEKLDVIFERFRQAEDSTTRKYGGTGLGLSIVRDLIHLQNGHIEVKSHLGSGTKVQFTIPYKIENVAAVDRAKKALSPDINFKDLPKILVVEDNAINQGLMVHILTNWNLKCIVASNGVQAVEYLNKEKFDLIFMDIQMPLMDGYATTREIRENLKLNTPIVAMTAHVLESDREKCIKSGMNDHISKPIREKDVLRVLSILFDTNPQRKNGGLLEPIGAFKTIDLTYMHDISSGDQAYEKLITEQFLSLVPVDLERLKSSFESGQYYEVKKLAHSLKSSVSIMGLENVMLKLDILENGQLAEKEVARIINDIEQICKHAQSEARILYASFNH